MAKNDEYMQITGLLSAGQIQEGEEAIKRARSALPLPVFLECVGNVHFYKREFQQAINKYEEAMHADPDFDSARYHYLVAVQKEREGDVVEAFKRYQAAIEIEPTFVDAYVELGGLLSKIEDFEGALTCYTDALKLDPRDLKNYFNRAEILRALSSTDPAQYAEQYQAALSELESAKARLPAIDESAKW
ncbi:MAG TPA: tetratricopeptide repeat protein [Pirellulales bacterium]|nr:tetratricopeptide repeat protein [Pirellulales bacterium]